MKVHRILVIAALFASGGVSLPSFADCSPACVSPDVCRYDSTRSPQFFCASPNSRFKGGAGGIATTPRSVAGASTATGPSTQTARTVGPKQNPQSYSFGATQPGSQARADATQKGGDSKAIKSPRDVATGQATGKRPNGPGQ